VLNHQKNMITEAQNNFITYVRTKMFWQNRLRNSDAMNPVFIPMTEIKERFFTNPISEIQTMVKEGLIEITQKETNSGHKATFYKALKAGGINPSMLKPKGKQLDELAFYMRDLLKLVTLSEESTSTLYFDTFLMLKKTNIDLFFTIDEFSGRVHTPISSFHRVLRPNILIDGEKTSSLDVVTMQPLLLGKILTDKIGKNDYSRWIESGADIYIKIQEKAQLKTRDEAKKRFFEILFSKPNEQLASMFGNSNWINWINEFKREPFAPNPHTLEKNHSNLAWLLQTTEVNLMRKVWQQLARIGKPFLSVHDEIIVTERDLSKAKAIFESVLDQEFTYYKLSNKHTIVEVELIHEAETDLVLTNNWLTEIEAIESILKKNDHKTSIKLKNGGAIINLNKFIESHLETVKFHNGNKVFLPYLNRLKEITKIITK
jgi:hypothetical protein